MKSIAVTIFTLMLVALSVQAKESSFETTFRTTVGQFLDSLDDKQKKACMLPLADTKTRWDMTYTGGVRPGIEISSLTAKQSELMKKALLMVLSKEGWELANKVARQDAGHGMGKYWLTCFGDPRDEGNFAFRISEHHLTIVHLEMEKGEVKEFGPVLLGANPPNIWKEDEVALMDAWKKIGDESVLIKKKRGTATKAMPKKQGVVFTSLNAEGQKAVKEAWKKRLRVFTPAIQQRIEKFHAAHGGWKKSRVAYYGEAPEKRCLDGGRWDFKCYMPGMLWDLQGSTGHIHMSLWVKDN